MQAHFQSLKKSGDPEREVGQEPGIPPRFLPLVCREDGEGR